LSLNSSCNDSTYDSSCDNSTCDSSYDDLTYDSSCNYNKRSSIIVSTLVVYRVV